jgi:hypothetical protein
MEVATGWPKRVFSRLFAGKMRPYRDVRGDLRSPYLNPNPPYLNPNPPYLNPNPPYLNPNFPVPQRKSAVLQCHKFDAKLRVLKHMQFSRQQLRYILD